MGYYAAPQPNLFQSALFSRVYSGRRFSVVDGGARDSLFEPLDSIMDHWTFYAFDADASAKPYAAANVKQIPFGLWSESTTVRLHLAKDPTTSSVHAPDLELFDRLYGRHLGTDVRKTIGTVDVPCISIDDAVKQRLIEPPNFLKLDVHSSEYEAIHGAQASLADCVCVLVETWTHPFHKGQKCHGHVEALLNNMGFYIYDIAPVYGYNPSTVYGRHIKGDRKFLTLTESVFFRQRVTNPDLAVLHVALLDLFRYTSHALQMAAEYANVGYIPPDIVREIDGLLRSFGPQRTFSWRHRAFYVRWARNIVKALLFPTRDVIYTGR